MRHWKHTALVFAALAVAGAIAAALVIATGVYNVAATEQHYAPVYQALEGSMRASIKRRAQNVVVPAIDDPAQIDAGLMLYRKHCAQCHGAPGVSPEPFALGLNPQPANLAYTARTWSAQELYWVIATGIRMTGMPAWRHRFTESETWAVVAFLKRLPYLAPDIYAELESRAEPASPQDVRHDAPDAKRGQAALHQYACITCHEIPGVVGATVPVGPPLARLATRRLIAGMLPNTEDNLVRWLRQPREINPRTAMPDLGVSEADARDIAAFLYTLK
ncbi:MAG: c-type cytochrome [Rhodospirillaceae bacterium]